LHITPVVNNQTQNPLGMGRMMVRSILPVTTCTIISPIHFLDLQSGYSFAAHSDISHADSDRTPTYRPTKARRSYEPRDWLVACEEAWEGEAPRDSTFIDDAATEATSHWSSLTVSTVRAGNWINPAPAPLRLAPTSVST
jgi:hypothetical protein